MDIKSLRYFAKIVELASLSRAARALFVAQPALSQQVAGLERELGAKLLFRSHKGVVPTAKGEVLYRHALSILRQVEQIRIDIDAEPEDVHGHVAIGMPSSTAAILALPLLEAIREQYPGIQLEINESGVSVLREWLFHGRLDLAVLYSDGPARSPGMMDLLSEPLCIVSAATSLDAPGSQVQSISLAQVADAPLVMSSPSVGMRHAVDKAFSSIGCVPNVVAELNMLQTIKAAVLAGVGSAILPASAVLEEWRSNLVKVQRIVDPSLDRHVMLCVNQALPLSAPAQAVHAATASVVRRLVQDHYWPVCAPAV